MPSPYLDANPSLASLLTGPVPLKYILPDGEYAKLLLFDRLSRRFRETQLRPVLKGVPDLSGLPKVGFSRGSRYVYLDFLLVYDGKWYWSRRRFFVVFPQGGTPYSPNRGGSTSMNDCRREAMAKVKLPPGKRVGNPQAPSLRPNPETRSKVRQTYVEGNNGGYFFTPTAITEVYYTRNWSGVRTPGFGALKKARKPVNNHSVQIVDIQDRGLIENINIPSTGIYFNTYSAWENHYNAPALPSHDALARSKALKKLRQRMEIEMDSNLALDVVQIKQTVRLITDSASRIARAGLSLKNGNIPGAARALWGSKPPYYGKKGKGPDHGASAANNWLQMQYGWKPLLNDIHGSMEAIARMNLADASIRQVAASAMTEEWDVNDVPLWQNPQKVGGWIRVQTRSHCKFGLRFTVEDHLSAFLAQTGFTNPCNLAWEIIPFSFVADWFLPIGPWLETLKAYSGLAFLDGYETLFTKQKVESSVRFSGPIGSPAPGQDLLAGGQYSRDVVLFNRTKLASFPVAQFPSFKSPLSVTHALNAIALVKAVFR